MTSGNYFDVLGVRTALGRLFNPGDSETEGEHPSDLGTFAFAAVSKTILWRCRDPFSNY
jgi:hypothetical protein